MHVEASNGPQALECSHLWIQQTVQQTSMLAIEMNYLVHQATATHMYSKIKTLKIFEYFKHKLGKNITYVNCLAWHERTNKKFTHLLFTFIKP